MESEKMREVIKLPVKSRAKDLNKFRIFCKKNDRMSYLFKKKVMEAVIFSSLLYGSETWLGVKFREVEKL